ncbi:alcohol dehydrogenase [Kocuria marina]|uniref:alcohol dehydrogenase n=1 Tax=Kocuria marina TaxID=223184 RepID=UPI00346014B4
MKAFAAYPDDRTIRETQEPVPQPAGREVLLKVTHSGVCHSDLHLLDGYYDLGSRGHLQMTDRGITYPLVMGHETVGEVVASGPEATGVSAGDVRLVFPWIGCGECTRCLAGHDNACAGMRALGVGRSGGYAEYILVPDSKYLVNIDGIDPAWAATLACSGVTSFSAINKVLPLPAEAPIAVIGAGGVGLTAISLLKALGHETTFVLDLNQDNLHLAEQAGASKTLQIDPATGAAEALAAFDGPIDAVIDFVNNTQTAGMAFDMLSKGGTMIQVGLFGGELTVPTSLLTTKMITIRGSYVGNLTELEQMVSLAQRGQVPRTRITPGPLTARGVQDSLEALEDRRIGGRIVLSPELA